MLACLAHKARMRVRDDPATMFCKRIAMKIKKAKEELEAIRLAEREIVEALIGNYRTVLKNIDVDGPAQEALARAAAMTAEAVAALDGLDEAAPAEEVAGVWAGRFLRRSWPGPVGAGRGRMGGRQGGGRLRWVRWHAGQPAGRYAWSSGRRLRSGRPSRTGCLRPRRGAVTGR